MTEYLSHKLTVLLCRKMQIDEDEAELYELGIEVLISTGFTSAVIILVGILLHRAMESLIFLACFMTLRNYSGGYHAKTRTGCFATSIACYLSSAGAAFLAGRFSGRASAALMGLGFILVFALMYKLAPAENPNKRLTPDWKKHNRAMTFAVLFFWIGTALLGSLFGAAGAVRQIWPTLLIIAALLWKVRKTSCRQ